MTHDWLCSRVGAIASVVPLLLFVPAGGFAVTCNGGATVRVVVFNPTASTISSGVDISGAAVSGGTTCTDESSSYAATDVTLDPGENVFEFDELNSGIWVHTVTVDVGSNEYDQFQKGVVLKAPDTAANPFTAVDWTYFPNSVKVFTSGDGGSGTCDISSCTLREAITSVNAIATSASNPALIYFTSTADPGTMGSGNLQISRPYVTIDGTNSAGNPWIVGDTLGTQDVFPVTIDLANVARIRIDDENITLKGLQIKKTVTSGTPQLALIDDTSAADALRVEATRIDGGAAGTSSCASGCDRALVSLYYADSTLVNVDGSSGWGSALLSGSGTFATVTDSWFHRNLGDTIAVHEAVLERNVVELAGFRALDDTIINSGAYGIYGQGSSDIQTLANLVRSNANHGAEVTAVSGANLSLGHDYFCGNGGDGVRMRGTSTGSALGTGLAAAYNSSNGIEFDTSITGGTMTFDDDSAFTANVSAGMKNSSSWITVSATNNQWRGVTGANINTCGSSSDKDGNITCSPAQDYVDVAVAIDPNEPVFPSNVIRTGQAVRVQGTGFNAIDGNPLAGAAGCSTGASAGLSNCCRDDGKANSCAGSPPLGVSGAGNCVVLKDRAGTWSVADVSAVTPTTAYVGLPGNISCIGQTNEKIRVSKRYSNGNDSTSDGDYCTNVNPKQ